MTFPREGKFTSSHFFVSKDVMGKSSGKSPSDPHFFFFGGTEVYTKGAFSSENSSALKGAKKKGLVYTKKLVFKGKEGKTYPPQSLQGVCGGSLRAVLVYRFRPPIFEAERRWGSLRSGQVL